MKDVNVSLKDRILDQLKGGEMEKSDIDALIQQVEGEKDIIVDADMSQLWAIAKIFQHLIDSKTIKCTKAKDALGNSALNIDSVRFLLTDDTAALLELMKKVDDVLEESSTTASYETLKEMVKEWRENETQVCEHRPAPKDHKEEKGGAKKWKASLKNCWNVLTSLVTEIRTHLELGMTVDEPVASPALATPAAATEPGSSRGGRSSKQQKPPAASQHGMGTRHLRTFQAEAMQEATAEEAAQEAAPAPPAKRRKNETQGPCKGTGGRK